MENIIEVSDGWKTLYQPILGDIINHDINKFYSDKKIGIKRVSSNNGLLDIEMFNEQYLPLTIRDKLEKAISDSKYTCEFCGSRNINNLGITLNGKIQTCCYECWKKNHEENSLWKCYGSQKKLRLISK